MSEVKRYDVEIDDDSLCDCGNGRRLKRVEYADGDYVLASDYETLRTANQRLETELAAIRGTIRTDNSAVIARLQANVARLREALQCAVDTVAADGLDDWYVKAKAALAGISREVQ